MLATDQDPMRPDILLPSTLDVMESAPFPASTGRAHGWALETKGKLSHGGSTGGGRAFIAKFPDGYISNNGTNLSDIFVAVAINTNGDDLSSISALVRSNRVDHRLDLGQSVVRYLLITGSFAEEKPSRWEQLA